MIRYAAALLATSTLFTACSTTPTVDDDDDAAAVIRAQGEPQPPIDAPFADTSYEEAETSPFAMD